MPADVFIATGARTFTIPIQTTFKCNGKGAEGRLGDEFKVENHVAEFRCCDWNTN